jgi:hypothetical protein
LQQVATSAAIGAAVLDQRCHSTKLAMTWLTFASTTAPQGISVVLPALAGAGLLFFLSQLFVPKSGS